MLGEDKIKKSIFIYGFRFEEYKTINEKLVRCSELNFYLIELFKKIVVYINCINLILIINIILINNQYL